MTQIFDGFWLPHELRAKFISQNTLWEIQYRLDGKLVSEQVPGAVGVRWPIFSSQQYLSLLESLEKQRQPIPPDFIQRLQAALKSLIGQFQQTDQPFIQETIQALSSYTGYSKEMIEFSLSLFEEDTFKALQKMIQVRFPTRVKKEFITLSSLGGPEGSIKFFPQKRRLNIALKSRRAQLPHHFQPPQMMLGYASGNVLGTAFIIALLGQISSLVPLQPSHQEEQKISAILVKNSRMEPLFVPLLFSAIESMDPALLRSTAIMIWDYEDTALQESIVSNADLVMAAAGDHTIEEIGQVIQQAKPQARFHPHGHKVSFTTIGNSYLSRTNLSGDNTGLSPDPVEDVALLAALDSTLWDQNGCLSSRIHFVEHGGPDVYTPQEYGQKLVNQLRILSQQLPRGTIPWTRIHDRFDQFNAQTISPLVDLCSSYDDDFIVVVDRRPWDQQMFRSMVNACMERTIVIRPIETIQEVPNQYLAYLSPGNLQTMYVAIDGKDHQTWSPEFAQFVESVSKRGITSIRTVGQSAFPQLAYSWDGYLPQSLSTRYPAGHFTTVEFDQTYPKINQITRWLKDRINLSDAGS